MAERRMVSKRVCNSLKFLTMPLSSQALYFHLNLAADDDGVVEAFAIMRMVGAVADDINILVNKQFIYPLNDEMVYYIVAWRENNKLRADRKIDSIYKDLLMQKLPDVQLLESKERADRKKDDHGTTTGHPTDDIGTAEGSLVQSSIEKGNLGKKSVSKKTPAQKRSYASSVRLTETEYQGFVDQYGENIVEQMIKILNDYKESNGKKYKNDAAAMRSWVIDAYFERANKGAAKGAKPNLMQTYEELNRRMEENGNDNNASCDDPFRSVW